MKIFHCDHCQNLVFFENFRCLRCHHALAYLPDARDLCSLEPVGENLWRSLMGPEERTYRLCDNYSRENICNWAIAATDSNKLCQSCRLTRVIPDLSQLGNREAWYRLEIAKRRLVYSLMTLALPVLNRDDDPESGLAFEFLSDSAEPSQTPVLTGHADGVITISVAEANDAEREKRRMALHEPYRTLLGHFRHEIGHYYWDRMIRSGERLEPFRVLFGDERSDYPAALQNYYEKGAPPPDWQERFVSPYASTHPWEDWAESWGHYLHMADTLETAAATGLSLQPRRRDEPTLKTDVKLRRGASFDQMIDAWFPLTYILNNLNRGLGLPDGYPFVLSEPALEKLHFIHETVQLCPKTDTLVTPDESNNPNLP
ncbi:MAG: putative zinc-binding peptidase [Pirellulaceae bacterium]|nr:putative zinc-binding peptidase [Pirellulaceae bacterium]